MLILAAFVNKFSRQARTIRRAPRNPPEENSVYFVFFLSGRSKCRCPAVASNNQTVLLHENGVGFEPRALWRVDLIGGAAVAFLVEMQQPVVERDPDFPICPVKRPLR